MNFCPFQFAGSKGLRLQSTSAKTKNQEISKREVPPTHTLEMLLLNGQSSSTIAKQECSNIAGSPAMSKLWTSSSHFLLSGSHFTCERGSPTNSRVRYVELVTPLIGIPHQGTTAPSYTRSGSNRSCLRMVVNKAGSLLRRGT